MPITNSLIIAPQWIGDAVMTEPLMRRLQVRGERLTVGVLPWVAPVYRAMAHVAEVIEFPFAHGGLQFKARRSLARQLEGRFDTAYICPNSLKSAFAAVSGQHSQARRVSGRGAWACSPTVLKIRLKTNARPWSRFIRRSVVKPMLPTTDLNYTWMPPALMWRCAPWD